MNEISENIIEEWKKLRQQGWSYNHIAEHYGYGYKRDVIRRRIKGMELQYGSNKLHKNKYTLNFYDMQTGKFIFSVNNAYELKKLYPNENNIDSRLSHNMQRFKKVKNGMELDGKRYLLLFIIPEKEAPKSIDLGNIQSNILE